MKKRNQLEKVIQTSIKLCCVNDGWVALSVGNPKASVILGIKGLPDIFGYTKKGNAFYIEVKIPSFRHKLLEDQMIRLQELSLTKNGFASATKSFENYKKKLKCPKCKKIEYGDICFWCNITK